MNVCFVIDNLACGGGQRQVVTLAEALAGQGNNVTILTYYPQSFFEPALQRAGVAHQCLHEPSRPKRVARFHQHLNRIRPDVVITFSRTPSMLAELATIPMRRFPVVAMEGTNPPVFSFSWSVLPLFLHSLASVIVCNSHTNRLLLEGQAPWLRKRLVTVYNGLNTDIYCPAEPGRRPVQPMRLLGLGRFSPEKNITGLIQAFSRSRTRFPNLELDWYGDCFLDPSGQPTAGSDYFLKVRAMVATLRLEGAVRLHPPQEDVVALYQGASAVILPSFFEGLPNVVCEGMSCGLPILTGDVCDAGNLVETGRNGVLFDPDSVDSIQSALEGFCLLDEGQRDRMGRESRKMALERFALGPFVRHFEEVLHQVTRQRPPVMPPHWVPFVPDSALQTVQRYAEKSRTQR
jgi:glycosyltransferase involved in cell wall biosynthesis